MSSASQGNLSKPEPEFTIINIFLTSPQSSVTLSSLPAWWFAVGKVLFSSLRSRWGISFQGRPGLCLQNKRSSPPILTLSLSSVSRCLSLSLQCVAREAACSSSGWLVWSRWEDGVCGAVCCGLRFTTGTIPPPASALAAHCSPGKGPYPLLPIPSCLWRNASGPRTMNTTPLFCFFFPFMAEDTPNHPSLCWFLSIALSLFLARHNICGATWLACQSSHLIIWALTFKLKKNSQWDNDAANHLPHSASSSRLPHLIV